ncbi:MAG: peptidoglycan bridge formation glycyltransferase FemA/FemB family protein [Lactovum sp.]
MENLRFQEINLARYEELEKQCQQLNFMQSSAMAQIFQAKSYELYYFEALKGEQVKMIAFMTSVSIFGGKKFELRFAPSFLSGDFEDEIFFSFLKFLKKFVKDKSALILKVVPNLDWKYYSDNQELLAEKNPDFKSQMQALSFEKTSPEIGYDEGEPTWHYVKVLSEIKDEKSLLKTYSTLGKRSIKKTKQFEICIRRLTYDELSDFKKVTELTSKRRGYRDHDLSYYQHFYQKFGESVDFLVAEINFENYQKSLKEQIIKLKEQIEKNQSVKKEKQRETWKNQLSSNEKRLLELSPLLEKYKGQAVVLAAALFVETKSEKIYLFGGSYEEFKNFCGPYAIQYFAMTDAIKKSIPLYNFYGITGSFDGGDGVLKFKQNFKGYSVQKQGAFTYYPQVMKYKFIHGLKKILRRY